MSNLTAILAKLDELEALEKKATPTNWRKGWLESYNGETGKPEAFIYRLSSKDPEETADNRICIRGSETKMDCDADAELIVASRNIFPSLCLALRKAVEALDGEREDAIHEARIEDRQRFEADLAEIAACLGVGK